MAALRCGNKALDDPHGSTAIWADALGVEGVSVRGVRLAFFIDEQSAARCDLFGAAAIGHESEVADAMEAVGQSMKEKATDELVRLQTQDLLDAILTVILPAERDVIVVESFEPAVCNGDAMGVAAEISENLGGAAERLLGVDHPVDSAHGLDENREGAAIGKGRQAVEEPQHAGLESRLQAFQKQAPEQP